MVFLCSVEFCFSPFFFFRTCFFYFVVDEWRNYFTSVIGQYNRLLSKIGRFKTSGEFSITNSLKLDFSLFCRVLLLAFFLYLFLFRVVLFFSFISIPIYNWEAFSYFQRPTANIIKKPIMQLNKVHRQNRNKMGEDRQRKLTANRQHFNNWVKHLVGVEWNVVYLNSIPFWTILSSL